MDELDERLYYEDSFLEEFDAEVVSCKEEGHYYKVALTETAFSPETSYLYSDVGTLNGTVRVIRATEEDGRVIHYTDQPVEVGSIVHGKIDWEYRFDMMQQHTAEHIVSGVIMTNFGYEQVYSKFTETEVAIVYHGPLSAEDLEYVERRANEIVISNAVVETRFPSKEELESMAYRMDDVSEPVSRIVLIPDCDICACRGPHVMTTGEIGMIKITGSDYADGVTQVTIISGHRALVDYHRKSAIVENLSKLFDAPEDQLVPQIKKLKEWIEA
ncbi:MAG: alanyl-tRNA editing protein [Lachnospiraceae bacterium]|nr:alanyl-tRNA editing protein [Lachnospiraceae bacterium]